MDNINLIESFSELKDVKNIDKETMGKVMQDVFKTIIVKKYGSFDNFHIIVNPNKGDLEIWRNRVIVDDADAEFDDNLHIKLSEALKIESDFTVGEEFSDEIKISDFGRRSISSLRQVLKSKILDISKESLFDKYKDRKNTIIVGEVYQVLRKEVIVLDEDGTEMVLPRTEQLGSDYFRKGDTVRAVVSDVVMRNNNISIVLSRTSNTFLERLFEEEIPEIFDGLIVIKSITREPGVRSKVAVESYDDRLDVVGVCVGSRGSKIRDIVKELGNEGIDIINYTTNTNLYILRALGQAKASIDINEDKKVANVFLPPSELSKAIGRNGLNIKQASKLTGYKINVFADNVDVDDVLIDDFSDEIDGWIIDILKGIGCDTAKSVLSIGFDDLVRRTDLEDETIKEIIKVLETEFK
jgi:N utilization substance protein A